MVAIHPRLPPWAPGEWQAADWHQVLSVDVHDKDSGEIEGIVRVTLARAGFEPQARQSSSESSSQPESRRAKVILFEGPWKRPVGPTARDALMPDGSAIVPVSVVLFGACIALFLDRGVSPATDPLSLTVFVGLPLLTLLIWLAGRTRRLVSSIGVMVVIGAAEPFDGGAAPPSVRVTVSASRLRSKVTYPKPEYVACRTLVASDGFAGLESEASQLRRALLP